MLLAITARLITVEELSYKITMQSDNDNRESVQHNTV